MLLSRVSSLSPPPSLRLSSLHSTFIHGGTLRLQSLHSLPSAVATTTRERERARGIGGGGEVVRCMAKERRVKMVAKQIMRDLSDLLAKDQVVRHAVLPESAFGADLYLSSVTTITDVEVTADLQIAKVYVSVFGDKRGKEVAINGLKSKAKYIRSQLGRRMRLRLTPELRFIEDESIERGTRVIEILDELKAEREGKGEEKEEMESSNKYQSEEEDDDWDEDETDEEGIFYVK